MILIYCLLLYCLGGIGASIAYHRVLTHRQAIVRPFLRKILVVLALPAGTPVQWVGTHRRHHQFSDREGDPHSPLVDGFWYAHCGWYIGSKSKILCILYALGGIFRTFFDAYYRPRSNQQYNHLAIDIQQDPFCRFLSKKYVFQFILWAYAGILTGTGYVFFEWQGVLATWLTMVLIYNFGDAVNSIGHLWGQRGAHFHKARNNYLLAWLSFGEGWHANHHDQADEAYLGKSNHRFDAGFAFMRLLSFLGLLKFTK